MTSETETTVRVTAKESRSTGVVGLELRREDGGELPPWEPGAHVDLVLGPDLVRQYSLCGDPADRTRYDVAVLREEHGRGGSAHVHDELAEGDTVTLRGPRNHFALVDADRYVFVAGGIGITPLRPMVHRLAAAGVPWTLAYGGRTRDRMAFREELGALAEVSLVPEDELGLLDLEALLGDPQEDVAVYCCGPEPLLQAVEAACKAWPAGALHVERFAAKPGAADGPNEGFEVEARRSGVMVTVSPQESIVEALEAAGVEVETSCREGTCGTCETTVLEGEPDHRDSLLTDEERAEGATMMICCGRCRSPRLVLDL
ncbi:PDR/VanB family oxidoreductase [Actinomycetospora sp. TBRC 11914]|uniref:PDR/VanB family oxidoreductase n=1 Tax=Actinomycetospora sp. TBRC 11914 TaxID=2729387 RepID=UPI00145EB204|nr:PDR/VanB family oxidoreductase [Actinomycetospora sp. TBRC 11914]NMO91610.1 oxidoreductase [Actinomycetospora sp. TBRC 11914]